MCKKLATGCLKTSMAKLKAQEVNGRNFGERWYFGRVREEER